ncbi:hypothetical protein S83_029276, partial [Arachis hypogaea]
SSDPSIRKTAKGCSLLPQLKPCSSVFCVGLMKLNDLSRRSTLSSKELVTSVLANIIKGFFPRNYKLLK